MRPSPVTVALLVSAVWLVTIGLIFWAHYAENRTTSPEPVESHEPRVA